MMWLKYNSLSFVIWLLEKAVPILETIVYPVGKFDLQVHMKPRVTLLLGWQLATQPSCVPFSDEHRLSDYSIGPESKLNLVIKPPEKASPEESSRRAGFPQNPAIWHAVAQVLGRHFSGADAEKVLEQLQKDYERSLRLLSLDDIERLATRLLHPEVAEAVEMGFLD
uniref:Ubiquitin like 4A n=1 Tax=Anolis carolinensis TaxID=28377 RepID=A0A803TSX1_ANOCA